MAERDSDHVAGHEIGASNAEIKTIGDDVEQTALGHQIDMNLRIAAQVFQDQRLQDLAGSGGERVDPDRPGRHLLLRHRAVHGAVDFNESRPDLFDEGPPGIGEGDAPRRPVEEANAELPLELRDEIAQRRRRDLQFHGRSPERLPPRDRHDGVELDEIMPDHCPGFRNVSSRSIPIIEIAVHR